MNGTFEDRVQSARLTRTGVKIADYFSHNKSVLAFQSLSTIAAQLNISDISIVRFSRSLGYEGFTDLKQHVQSELAELIDGNQEDVNTLVKFATNMERQKFDRIRSQDQVSSLYCGMINETIRNNTIDTIERAADLLIAASNRYIVGSFSRIGSVEMLRSFLLASIGPIETITDWGYNAIVCSTELTKDACVVLFSFGRFMQLEREILQAVKRTGAHLIVFSDKNDTPAAKLAEVFLYSKANAGLPFHSNACNAMLSELIASFVATKTWPTAKERLSALDFAVANMSQQ